MSPVAYVSAGVGVLLYVLGVVRATRDAGSLRRGMAARVNGFDVLGLAFISFGAGVAFGGM